MISIGKGSRDRHFGIPRLAAIPRLDVTACIIDRYYYYYYYYYTTIELRKPLMILSAFVRFRCFRLLVSICLNRFGLTALLVA